MVAKETLSFSLQKSAPTKIRELTRFDYLTLYELNLSLGANTFVSSISDQNIHST